MSIKFLQKLMPNPQLLLRHHRSTIFTCKSQSRVKAIASPVGCSTPNSHGLVLGVYANEFDRTDNGVLTPMAAKYNESVTNGVLHRLLQLSGPVPRLGECRIFYNLDPNFVAVAVCGLGNKSHAYNEHEKIDENKEAIRIAVATGCQELQKLETEKIFVEDFGHAESAAEGGRLALWRYQELRAISKREFMPQFEMYLESRSPNNIHDWTVGLEKANAQNLARKLMETPANIRSPTRFAEQVISDLCDSGINVEVKVQQWAAEMKMTSYLTIARSSNEPPIFLELAYYGAGQKTRPVVMIGQGITFNSGGISLDKSPVNAQQQRGTFCGAASVVGACRAIAALRLPINIRVLIPLCEHMIDAKSVRPGDVIYAKNGRSIEIERTSDAAVLILNDALSYAQTFNPTLIIDVGTISSDTSDALGQACSVVFTPSDDLWTRLEAAGVHTGDRLWRMPLWNFYRQQMQGSSHADLRNVGIGHGGGACKAAAFLNEFVATDQWIHIDAHNVVKANGRDHVYLKRGMAGRPTRTLIEFIAKLCRDETIKKK